MKWFPKNLKTKEAKYNWLHTEILEIRKELLQNAHLENVTYGKLRGDRVGNFVIIYRLAPTAEEEYDNS